VKILIVDILVTIVLNEADIATLVNRPASLSCKKEIVEVEIEF